MSMLPQPTESSILELLEDYRRAYQQQDLAHASSLLGAVLASLSAVCNESFVKTVKDAMSAIVTGNCASAADLQRLVSAAPSADVGRLQLITTPMSALLRGKKTTLRPITTEIRLSTELKITYVKLVEYDSSWCLIALLAKTSQNTSLRGLSSFSVTELKAIFHELQQDLDIKFVKVSSALEKKLAS